MEHIENAIVPVESPVPPGGPIPSISDCLAETFPATGRKPRHDGWTAAIVSDFLHHLAETGIVEHAAAAVGRSVSSAYAFRNRRGGRAFAKMWDAVLVHRARARLASELQARAIAGCVSLRKRDGLVVGEYHYHDNRLATAILSRLDRLAEREASADEHLRALSEDLEDYCACLEAGEDAEAFVEARRPPPPEAASASTGRGEEALAESEAVDDDPALSMFADAAGCPTYRDVPPGEIDVLDLDPQDRGEWDSDQWVRAYRSGLMAWLHVREQSDPGFESRPGSAFCFHFLRAAAAAAAAGVEPDGGGKGRSGLDRSAILEWDDGKLVRALQSGFLQSLPSSFWDRLAARCAPSDRDD